MSVSGVVWDAKILTVSDSVGVGLRQDLAGPLIAMRLGEAGFRVVEQRVVPDGIDSVATALRECALDFAGLIVTTGGTGLSQRDLTPEGTLLVIDREAPGLSEAMRLVSPFGRLSRARAGTLGRCLILNTPGSPSGAVECLEAVIDVLPHALDLLSDQQAPHPPEIGGRTSTSSSGPTGERKSAMSPLTQT
jgi:molybdopterin adenylyltransferase